MATSSLLPRIYAAIDKRIHAASKHIYQYVRLDGARPQILFIVGCQRSGTTLLVRLFNSDYRCRVFGEFSALSCDDPGGIRLNPLPDVAAAFRRVRVPLIIAKPLVETQNVKDLLAFFPSSKVLFVYRHFEDVAKSDTAKFGLHNGIDNLRPIVAGCTRNWRSEGARPFVRETVTRHFSQDMNPYDAAVLFWFARNQLFFDLALDAEPRVMLCRYEYLVGDPAAAMQRIYAFAGVSIPDLSHTRQVHSASIGKGGRLPLKPEVRVLCEQLLARLDASFRNQIERDEVAGHSLAEVAANLDAISR